MDDSERLTVWIQRLREGDAEAAEVVWNQCFDQLVRYARKRLQSLPSREADAEDIALSAIDTLVRRIGNGQFSKLADRQDLWRVLYDVTRKRVAREYRRHLAEKRGAGKVHGESVFGSPNDADSGGGLAGEVDAGQEFADVLATCCSDLFEALREQPDGEGLVEVTRHRLSGYTVQEVADRLQIAKRSVERRLVVVKLICKEVLSP